MNVLKEFLSSKKALVWVSTGIVVVGNKIVGHFGYEMDGTTVALFVASAAAYLVGQGLQDHGEAAAKVTAESTRAVSL